MQHVVIGHIEVASTSVLTITRHTLESSRIATGMFRADLDMRGGHRINATVFRVSVMKASVVNRSSKLNEVC